MTQNCSLSLPLFLIELEKEFSFPQPLGRSTTLKTRQISSLPLLSEFILPSSETFLACSLTVFSIPTATWQKRKVAVKTFNAHSDVDQLERLNAFNEFRREVWLMRYAVFLLPSRLFFCPFFYLVFCMPLSSLFALFQFIKSGRMSVCFFFLLFFSPHLFLTQSQSQSHSTISLTSLSLTVESITSVWSISLDSASSPSLW